MSYVNRIYDFERRLKEIVSQKGISKSIGPTHVSFTEKDNDSELQLHPPINNNPSNKIISFFISLTILSKLYKFFYLLNIKHLHSSRSASTGLIFAACLAGNIPDKLPSTNANNNAPIINQ